MKEALKKLNICIKTGIFTFLIALFFSIAGMACFFYPIAREINLGLILGLIFGGAIHFVYGLVQKSDDEVSSHYGSLIFVYVRLGLLIGFTFLMGYLYYGLGLHTFNVFSCLGGYFIAIMVFIVICLKAKHNG